MSENENEDEVPESPMSPLTLVFASMNEMYKSMLVAGFSKDAATSIIAKMLMAGAVQSQEGTEDEA